LFVDANELGFGFGELRFLGLDDGGGGAGDEAFVAELALDAGDAAALRAPQKP